MAVERMTGWNLSRRVALCVTLVCLSLPALAGGYDQTNLVSDISGIAKFTNPKLVNPWGIAFSATSPIWIADNGAGVSTLYHRDGTILPLVVTIPVPGGACPNPPAAAPTGLVFNGDAKSFVVTKNGKSGSALFIFSTEDGTISGWNPTVDTTCAVLEVDNSANPTADAGAVYKGLAIGQVEGKSFIYASNFRSGQVEMYDSQFHLVKTFTDASVPPGFAPFGVQNINGVLFVTFALQDDQKHDDVAGPGNGFVDVFDLGGTLIKSFASGGVLNSPWGVALAPAHFGQFSNHVLIGNFGDGHINAFDLHSGKSDGPLKNDRGDAIFIGGLWGLKFGAGGANNGPVNTLFFTAGIGDEGHGLFGTITVNACEENEDQNESRH